MTRFLRPLLVTALALSLVGASGCGSSKSNDYVNAVNKAANEFASSVKSVPAATSPSQIKSTTDKYKAAIDKVIGDLKAASPPDKVKALHNELIGELQQFDAAVTKFGAASGTSDPAKLTAAATQFAKDFSAIVGKVPTTIDAINKKLHS